MIFLRLVSTACTCMTLSFCSCKLVTLNAVYSKQMLRRYVSTTRMLAASRTRSYSIANVKLTSLLPTKGATSVNDFIKQHKIDIPLIKNDLELTAWPKLSAKQKHNRMSDVVSFDAHPKLKKAVRQAEVVLRNETALNALAAIDIKTLEQFLRSPDAKVTVDRRVAVILNARALRLLWELFDPHVDAFKKRVDAINSTASEPKPYSAHLNMRELTYRHAYAAEPGAPPGEVQHVLGRFHQQTCRTLLKHSFSVDLETPLQNSSDAKENHPINYLIAGPRQGKSLILSEVVAKAPHHGHNFCGVPITFNSQNTLETRERTVDELTAEFWGRFMHALYLAMLPIGIADELSFGDFNDLPFFYVMNSKVALDLARKLELGRVVIAVDEMSRLTDCIKQLSTSEEKTTVASNIMSKMYAKKWSLLCSGFTQFDAFTLSTISDRRTANYYLTTVSSATRIDFDPMRAFLEKAYPGSAFTPERRVLYEVVKNVAGYSGLWVELKVKHDKCKATEETSQDIDGLGDLRPPLVSHLKNALDENPLLLSDYWRAAENRHDDTLRVVHRDALKKLTIVGAVLPKDSTDPEAFFRKCSLGPLAFTHPLLSIAREHSLIATAVTALGVEPWTKEAKGAALEAVVDSKLVLTASYVNDPIAMEIMAASYPPLPAVTVRTLITRMCGRRHTTVNAKREFEVDESLPAEFPNLGINFPLAKVSESVVEKPGVEPSMEAIKKEVSAFPAVWSKKRAADGEKFASNEKQQQRLEENIAALNSSCFSVIRPMCPMNPGCDRAMFFRVGTRNLKGGVDQPAKVLFLFEMKYHASGSSEQDTVDDISTKALHALNGVRHYVNPCNIRRVCFVYCNSAVRGDNTVNNATSADANAVVNNSIAPPESPFLMEKHYPVVNEHCDTLIKSMSELGGLGCTSSLHTVWNEEEWRNLLDSLYLIVPDMDEEPIGKQYFFELGPLPLKSAKKQLKTVVRMSS